MKIYTNKEPNLDLDKIIYTGIFNELVDLIHFGICINKPLILEGSSGQGKQTAINYISKILNYQVENIIITKSFSVNDLFKKTVIDTKKNEVELIDIETQLFVKFHEKDNGINKQRFLFVFHNINYAESDVLSKLSEIFNHKNYNSSNYVLIGIINIEESSIERDSYYYNYFSKSIYYIVNSSNEKNIKQIIEKYYYIFF